MLKCLLSIIIDKVNKFKFYATFFLIHHDLLYILYMKLLVSICSSTVKTALTARSSTPGIQLRPSVMQNHQKHNHKYFKRKVPFRSRSSQALHWHAKDSNNNLVISFSDDDSGRESEERCPEKDVKRMDDTSVAHDLGLSTTLFPKLTDVIEREPDGSKQKPNKGFANDEIIASVDCTYETSCGPRRSTAENDSHINKENLADKTSACLELGLALDPTKTGERLQPLRHQIAAREDRLTSTVGSDSNQHCLHAMKPEAQATGIRKHANDANLGFEVNELSGKRLKSENDRTFHVDNSCTNHQFDSNNAVKSSVIKSKDSVLALSAANLHNESLSKNVDDAKNEVHLFS